ncbi:TetR/AcrR family transcriptional regulator [Geomonas sp.]|uniref:TetR/AcrR family transcriptional regulator n=1 Tax=Geomonas sp. TaxID=2651584 RepID=UPI002B4A6890|nr:TetR/AcrR family transcriptional regulator [Geomonas sp.]HJV36256.1 TetR/AcrR family transcriptional regulator [Geomonas sp.]
MARPKKSTAGEGDAGVRQRLLEAALTLFTTRGYASTTVREIVESAGVSKPVLYYYFNSKEGIYLELISEPFRRHQELIASIAGREGSAKGRILTMCEVLFDHFMENIQVARLLFSIYYGPPQGTPLVDMDAQCRVLDVAMLALVKEAMAAGEIGSGQPDDVCWTLTGMLNAAFQEQLTPEPKIDGPGLQRALSLLFTGIGGDR